MKNLFRAPLHTYACILSLLLLPAVLASADDQPAPKPTDVPATVIAHLPLPQATGSEMMLQKEHGKQYLYVQQAAKPGYMVVDVSHPESPSLLKRAPGSNQATEGDLKMVTPTVGIAEAPEKTPETLTSPKHATETVRVLDLSDPKNPKTLETFEKVTSTLADGRHGLLYIANNDGLWVLRYSHPWLLEPAKTKPPCTSESEIQAMPPECQ
ncbi:MAG: hypothetical protein WAK56_00265 [Candidatus Sulfotelmatobacter sp.]